MDFFQSQVPRYNRFILYFLTWNITGLTLDEGSAEDGAGEHEHRADAEEAPVGEDEEPDVVAAVHAQRVRGVAPLDERALMRDRSSVGICTG